MLMEKVAVADLNPGDKILIGETEFIYHLKRSEVCGVCGETYETGLISYRQARAFSMISNIQAFT